MHYCNYDSQPAQPVQRVGVLAEDWHGAAQCVSVCEPKVCPVVWYASQPVWEVGALAVWMVSDTLENKRAHVSLKESM